MIIVVRQPRLFSVTPSAAMVRISATWPMLITGMIQLPAMPTPPTARSAPKKRAAQLKNRLCTVASMSVTIQSTRMNGRDSSFIASSQANFRCAGLGRRGGVCGSVRLNAASRSEATPATMKVHVVPAWRAGPVKPDASTVPTQSTMPWGFAACTLSQSTRMKVNGQAARIHPIVPPMRTIPNSFCASFICAKAIELVIEIVGT